jgi:hypothetical protein
VNDDSNAVLREPPVAGNEVDTLLGALERQRGYVAWKCGNLERLYGRDRCPPWNAVDWEADPDREWHSAAGDTPEQLMSRWQEAVRSSRTLVAEAIADGGLDRPAAFTWPDGRTPSLRRLLIDAIEEYARHVGHADLIRESVDGLVGEDPD